MKNSKITIIAIVIIILATAVFLYFRKSKQVNPESKAVKEDEVKEPVGQKPKVREYGYPWELGMKSPNITYVQRALNWIYKLGLSEDGNFGPKTQAAMKEKLNKSTIGSLDDYNNTLKYLRELYTKQNPGKVEDPSISIPFFVNPLIPGSIVNIPV